MHVAALVGLAFYLPAEFGPRSNVDSGLTIVASFSPASAQAEPEAAVVVDDVEVEPQPQDDTTPMEAELEITPAATRLARREPDTKDVIPLPAVPAESDKTPPPQVAERQTSTKEAPPPERTSKTALRQTKTALEVAQHSVAMPYQAAVSVGVEQMPRPSRTNRPPIYPAEEVRAGVTGLVRIRCAIAASGTVDSALVETTSGSTRLDEAALTAVRTWHFEPAQRGGIAVRFEVILPVRFTIR